jgi:acetylornithine/N-succinyldiaminopimelate aminotransferase
MARKYQSAGGKPERFRIITFEGAFHGRTLATLAAGGQKKYLDGFGPVVEGFDQVPFCDLEATKRAIGPATAAILIEPIMGEGGVRVVPPEFLKALRRLCDENGLLLVYDEVQTGMGRTGDLFAHQRYGLAPDIMALAKALGGGFPLGACLSTAEAAKGMTAGTHGSTFGGNPIAMAAGNAVLDVMLAPGFLERVLNHRLWDPIAGVYRTGDGHFVRLHTNFAHHRTRVVGLLGCADARDSVAAALALRSTWFSVGVLSLLAPSP